MAKLFFRSNLFV